MSTKTSVVTGVDFIAVPVKDYEASKKQSDAFGFDFARHTAPIAFQVDDVEAARAELESKGVEFQGETIDSGVCHQAIFQDPDGNVLDIHNRYAPKDQKPGG